MLKPILLFISGILLITSVTSDQNKSINIKESKQTNKICDKMSKSDNIKK